MSLLVVGSVALDDIEAPAGQVKSVLGGAASYFGVASSRRLNSVMSFLI